MDFSDKELKMLLQALYRFRGEVSGASQSEQNKLGLVSTIIGKIEDKVGPIRAPRTRFDEEMAENLAILTTGRTSAARKRSELDKGDASPKVKNVSSRATSAREPRGRAAKAAGAAGAAKAPSARATRAAGPKKAGTGKTKS